MKNKNIDKQNKSNNFFSDRKYIDFIYSSKLKPKTNYPFQFANYLETRFLKKKGSLIDLGCGRGDMLKAFKKIGFKVAGVDLSPLSVELNNSIPIEISNLSKDELPYDDSSFDYVFSKSVIEHLDNPSFLINESLRILKPGGKCIFLTPSWKHNYWGPFYNDHTHITPFTQFSLKNILSMSGYSKVKVFHFRQLPILWRYPFLKIISICIAKSPLRYSPMYEVSLPESLNKIIRFSNEVMLLGYGEKS